MKPTVNKIIVCVNHRANPSQPSCAARGSVAIAQQIELEVTKRGLAIEVERFYCLGHCEQGPNLRLAPDGRFFHRFEIKDVAQLLCEAKPGSNKAGDA